MFFTAPSGHPSNSSGIALNSTHIHLTWDPPPRNQTHGEIQEYRITIVEYETENVTVHVSENTELVVGPLHPYYTYNCSVQAVTVELGPPIIILVRTQEAGRSSYVINAVDIINNTWYYSTISPTYFI